MNNKVVVSRRSCMVAKQQDKQDKQQHLQQQPSQEQQEQEEQVVGRNRQREREVEEQQQGGLCVIGSRLHFVFLYHIGGQVGNRMRACFSVLFSSLRTQQPQRAAFAPLHILHAFFVCVLFCIPGH